jgi:hypothetical protein
MLLYACVTDGIMYVFLFRREGAFLLNTINKRYFIIRI